MIPRMPFNRSSFGHSSAAAQGLQGCHRCFKLVALPLQQCDFCGASVSLRKPHAVQNTLAYLVTAIVLFVPANLLPIMITSEFGAAKPSTIIEGVILLWHHGSYPTALVIFIASVLVPLAKVLALLWLCWSVMRGDKHKVQERKRLLILTELVGRWSMVDVFVVALLVALVQLAGVLTIAPGPAALAFCGVVLFTMLAAHAFDGRLLWDHAQQRSGKGSAPAPSQVTAEMSASGPGGG